MTAMLQKSLASQLFQSDSFFDFFAAKLSVFLSKVWIRACKKCVMANVFRENNKLSLLLLHVNTQTVMAKEMEAQNYLLLCDDKQVWRAKQVISAAWLGLCDAWKKGTPEESLFPSPSDSPPGGRVTLEPVIGWRNIRPTSEISTDSSLDAAKFNQGSEWGVIAFRQLHIPPNMVYTLGS